MVCQWFGLKTTGTVCQWFDLKITGTICQWFGLKTIRMVFSGLASKLVATVVGFLVEPHNQGGGGFPVWASKPAVMIW
jgi:hypothetical protein